MAQHPHDLIKFGEVINTYPNITQARRGMVEAVRAWRADGGTATYVVRGTERLADQWELRRRERGTTHTIGYLEIMPV